MSEGDVALACASAFVSTLNSFGLRDACVSPGSRSTPIALALARNGHVRVHVHLDERSSAFFALGLAKASGRPVAVACTSGTGAANLFPAIVEASTSRTPLIALTADRPPEQRDVGANQTIDQRELFGRHVTRFLEAPVPEETKDSLRAWAGLAAEAYGHACAPGPVHVNLPFREPLVPAGAAVELGDVMTAFGGVSPSAGRPAEADDVDAFVAAIAQSERGLVYLGTLRSPSPDVLVLAERLGWPVIAEPTSGCRLPGVLAAGQFLIANESFASDHLPDVMVQVGAAPTSRPALALARSARRLVIVDPDKLVADPNRRAEHRFAVNVAGLVGAAVERLQERPAGEWRASWHRADALARAAVDRAIEAWDDPFEGRVARDLADGLPATSTLVVGSSMPVRDLDAYMLPRPGLRVLANRGASGIDGFVSTTLGVAAAGAPTTALCGDLTFVHDAGALLWNARRGLAATFVVVENGGGVIFSFLDQRSLPELRDLFTTPHGLDLGELCRAAGAEHRLVERAAELAPAVDGARAAGGVQVIEVRVDPEANVRRHAEVHAAVATALRSNA